MSATLTVHLDQLAANYRTISAEVGPNVSVAAMVKADAYGIGAEEAVPALRAAGCRMFFVARLDAAVAVRERAGDCSILVLDGPSRDDVEAYVANGVFPVLNSLGQLELWRSEAKRLGQQLPAVLHVDTGMSRLGFPFPDFELAANEPQHYLDGLAVQLVMSHLASADAPDDEQNQAQLEQFRRVRQALGSGSASLANSSGVYLGSDYHFDLVRPGYALYGGNPQPSRLEENPMEPVVEVLAPILEVFTAEPGATVGYGATHRLERSSRLATLGVGYGDGFLRSGSDRGSVMIADHSAPILGRVSMDLTTIDVTDVPMDLAQPGQMVEVVGPHRTVDLVARDAGTIGYEILTSLGSRYRRTYLGRPLAVRDVYEHVGGQKYFVALVDHFYDGVLNDEILRPLYPEDLTEARRNTADFLAQYWGGPDDYNQRRGHPRLRMRHAPFPIDRARRDAWVDRMTEAVHETDGATDQVKSMLLQYFSTAADHMINQPE